MELLFDVFVVLVGVLFGILFNVVRNAPNNIKQERASNR